MADWRHEWLWGAGKNPPPSAGRKEGQTCLVVGPARCVFEDLRVVRDWPFDCRLAVNHAALFLKAEMDGLCTLHPEMAQQLLDISGKDAAGAGYVPVHSHKEHPAVNVVWPFASARGTSGLFGVKVALAMGFSRIVGVGLPFDGTGHYFDAPWDVMPSYMAYGASERDNGFWRVCAELFKDRVRFVSGNTAEWFGQPSREWFDGQ